LRIVMLAVTSVWLGAASAIDENNVIEKPNWLSKLPLKELRNGV
jgi:hypothetical protein